MKTERINVPTKQMPPQGDEPIKMKVERIAVNRAPKSPETAMSAAMADQYPWTSDTIAEELAMPLASFRAWKMKAEQSGKLTKPVRGSLFCIEDPEVKMRLRFSDAYVDKLRALRGGIVRRKEANVSALQHAKLKILVPVFDDNIAKFLLKKFKNEKGIEEYLKDHLVSVAKPHLGKIEELRKKFEQEMAALLAAD